MPLHYLDASALIKRYLDEIGSDWVNVLFISEPCAISAIAGVEVASALARRTRERTLTEEQRIELYKRFLGDLPDLVVIAVTSAVLDHAALLAGIAPLPAPLRALDAIHLASALVAFEQHPPDDGSPGRFVTADRQLQRAAEHAGLLVVDPEAQDPDEAGC